MILEGLEEGGVGQHGVLLAPSTTSTSTAPTSPGGGAMQRRRWASSVSQFTGRPPNATAVAAVKPGAGDEDGVAALDRAARRRDADDREADRVGVVVDEAAGDGERAVVVLDGDLDRARRGRGGHGDLDPAPIGVAALHLGAALAEEDPRGAGEPGAVEAGVDAAGGRADRRVDAVDAQLLVVEQPGRAASRGR
ncbi:MAG: hypothetical protein R3F65_18225 [bacterium]